jgi:hypothetical protein
MASIHEPSARKASGSTVSTTRSNRNPDVRSACVRANQGDTANILMRLRPPDDHFDDASKVFGKFDHRGDSSQGQRTYHPIAHHWFLISANLSAAGPGMAADGAGPAVAGRTGASGRCGSGNRRSCDGPGGSLCPREFEPLRLGARSHPRPRSTSRRGAERHLRIKASFLVRASASIRDV